MKLEDELQQTKPFYSEKHKLAINLQFTSSWLTNLFMQVLKPFDLTPQQFNVLRILNGKYPEGYCNLDITQRMVEKSSNSSRIVDKLLEKGFVLRTEDPNDRRHVIITISEAGREVLQHFQINDAK